MKSAKQKNRAVFLTSIFVATVLELFFAFDKNENTEPLTYLIVDFIPAWIGLPAISFFGVWLIVHFIKFYKIRRWKK